MKLGEMESKIVEWASEIGTSVLTYEELMLRLGMISEK